MATAPFRQQVGADGRYKLRDQPVTVKRFREESQLNNVKSA